MRPEPHALDKNGSEPTGLVVALIREARSLIRGHIALDQPVSLGQHNYCWVSGMGAARAERAARALLDLGCQRLASWGCAGGLSREARAGRIFLPSRVLDEEGRILPVDPIWRLQLAHELSSPPQDCEDLLTVDHVVADPAEKTLLREHYPVALVDLEAFAVARVASERGLPFIAIKAPLDSHDQGLPSVFTRILDPWGRIALSRLPFGLAQMRIRDFSGLRLLWQNDRLARQALRRFAQALGWTA